MLDKSSLATQTDFLKIKLVGKKLSQPLKKSGATNFFYSIDPSISIRDYARVVHTHFLKKHSLEYFFSFDELDDAQLSQTIISLKMKTTYSVPSNKILEFRLPTAHCLAFSLKIRRLRSQL